MIVSLKMAEGTGGWAFREVGKRPTFAKSGQMWATLRARPSKNPTLSVQTRERQGWGQPARLGKDPHLPKAGKCGPPSAWWCARSADLADAANVVVAALNRRGAVDTIGAASGQRDQDHNRHDADNDPAPRQSTAGVRGAGWLLRVGVLIASGALTVWVGRGTLPGRILAGRRAGDGGVAALGSLLARLRLRGLRRLSAGRLLGAGRLLRRR